MTSDDSFDSTAPMPMTFGPNRLPKNVTFVLTEECNFRCSYCYLVHKNSRRRMDFVVARAAIDYLMTHRELFPEPAVNWDFIGGEPLLEVDLMERIIDYTRLRAYELDHPWFAQCNYGITTNGSLYGTPRVQRFIERYGHIVGMSITLDGPRHVHDAARIYKNGGGTYADVVKNIPLWLKQYPNTSTKVTLAPENIDCLAESILHLFELGIRQVHANVVFEDVWRPGDDAVLEEQLDLLADEGLRRGLWRTHSCSLFSRMIGEPIPRDDNGNWCGAGRMLAIDADGVFYPCNRFLGFAMSKRQARPVGSVTEGLDLNKVRPFYGLTRLAQSPRECVDCPVARGCAWCQGLNYDDSDTGTIYQRATHLCLLHKARVRANRRFYARLDGLKAVEAPVV